MITIACTNCKTTLQIDEAFAGGVCRCQHCGTIQTVPSRLRNAGDVPGKSKTLYRKKARAGVGAGLDELAEVIASSGALTGSGLRSSAREAMPPAAAPTASRGPALYIVAGLCGILMLALLAVLLMGRGDDSSGAGSAGSFVGIPVTGSTVVYVLDRGAANQGTFGDAVEATFRSLASLGDDRKFQIIFWNNGSELAYPAGAPTYANAQNLLSARRALESVAAFGASDVGSAIRKAADARPDQVILTTAKGWDLDESFVKTVTDALAPTKARVTAISIGGESKSLQALATATGGSYHVLTAAQLRAFDR